MKESLSPEGFQFLLVRLRAFSFLFHPSVPIRFQFLLVRLRVSLRKSRACGRKRISIPSGAIKSSKRNGACGFKQEFQFLLVRLRALRRTSFEDFDLRFQFLLVRLRV